MPTVGFDATGLDRNFKAHAFRGIGRYVLELTKHIEKLLPQSDLSLELFHREQLLEESPFYPVVKRLPLGRITATQQIVYPLHLALRSKKSFDLLHFPAHMDSPAWGITRYMLTVLDLIPLIFKDLYIADKPNIRFNIGRWLEKKAITNATMLLAISECTARDVSRILGYPAEKIVVTPLGVDPKFFDAKLSDDELELRGRFEIPADRPIILYVGAIDQRKNIAGLLEVFKRVLDRCREAGEPKPVLLMAGRIQEDGEYPKVTQKISELEIGADVLRPGYIDDADLIQIYSISSLFLFMSLYEGFGLPPLEALAAGVPVVSSNTSSLPEVLGDAALLVAPDDYDKAAEQAWSVLSNSDRGQKLSELGQKQAAKFTWERTAEKTLEAYERCLREG